MPAPRMVVIAGPSGGGKSSLFSIHALGVDAFSTDQRAAELLGLAKAAPGPVHRPTTPEDVRLYLAFRQQAGAEMREFIEHHISTRQSFAYETTLRPETFEQGRAASRNGFRVIMSFIAGGDKAEHIRRVAERGERGGHVASPTTLGNTYERSMAFLKTALEENRAGYIDSLSIHHNPRVEPGTPAQAYEVVSLVKGEPTRIAEQAPAWFHAAVSGTDFQFERLLELSRDDRGR